MPEYVPGDLVEVIDSATVQLDSPSLIEAMAPADLVALVVQIADIKKRLGDIEGEAKRVLAAGMTEDQIVYGEFVATRSRKKTEEWDADGCRSAVRSAVVRRLCTDPATGEIHGHLARVANDAIDAVYAVTSTGAKAKLGITGLKGLGLDANNFRDYIEGELKVEIKGVTQ
jgi:hypothetical protein